MVTVQANGLAWLYLAHKMRSRAAVTTDLVATSTTNILDRQRTGPRMSTTSNDLELYFSRIRSLCQRERAAEVEQSSLLLSACGPKLLEQKGLALLGLGVSSVQIGLGGKRLLDEIYTTCLNLQLICLQA